MKLDWEKFKDVVHYVVDKASSNPSVLGAIKLNKVLWYSDAIHYMVTGESITGETYVKRQFGPVPKHVLGAIDELVKDGKILRGKVDHFGHMKNEYIVIQEASKDKFTAEELDLVDTAYEHVCLNHTAMSVSEETHGIIWQLAELGEEIPLSTAFASSVGEITENDLTWAENNLKKAA